MRKLNFWRQMNVRAVLHPSCLMAAVSLGLLSIYVLNADIKSYAWHEPAPQTATFDPPKKAKGTVRVYPNGDTPTKTPNQHPVLRSTPRVQDHLWVAGDSSSWAHLQFWRGNPYTSARIDPVVQAGADSSSTKYTFACHADLGAGVWGWGLTPVGTSACEGIILGMSTWQSISRNGNYLAGKADTKVGRANNYIANGDSLLNQTIVSRTQELTLIYAHDLDGKLAIDVLVGAVTISSASNPPVPVRAGTRYIYSGDGSRGVTSRINPTEISKSPSVQIFLEPTNWSRGVAPLLNRYRTALNQSSSTFPGRTSPGGGGVAVP